MNELTEEIYKGAEANRKEQAKIRTTAQLPVFRDCSNLLYIIMKVMYHAPRKMTKPLDEAVACAVEMCRCVALANEMRGAERAGCINIAIANANTLNTVVGSLTYLGVFPKQTGRDFKKKTGRVIAQCIGWRDSATRQGLPHPEGGAA